VAKSGTSPILIISSHLKGEHKLCRDVIQMGARGFIAKPFDEDPPEDQIKKVLGNGTAKPTLAHEIHRPFQGGDLVVHENQFELIGIDIGGSRSGTIIRGVITALAPKPGESAKRMSAKSLATALGGTDGPSVTSAINDFRTQYIDKMRAAGWECSRKDIIETLHGGGYRIKSWIVVREGFDEHVRPQIDSDADQILKIFAENPQRTRKQINDSVNFPALRVKAALARLTESKRLNVSGSGATTTYEVICAS
jgi:DNA-binding response OmpR family regulator